MGPKREKIQALEKKMTDLGIKKKDIEFRFIKASGKGGQKVNKTSSAVFAKHEKTGLFVKYGKERSQHLNRFFALRLLLQKIEAQINGEDEQELKRVAKLKKQKLRRKRKTRKKLS
ncbi:MAG: peptide chain release factor-like protein [Desulfobacula sp.]|nr:peptide chain release factor-like protein [Desulfobacula sp.]